MEFFEPATAGARLQRLAASWSDPTDVSGAGRPSRLDAPSSARRHRPAILPPTLALVLVLVALLAAAAPARARATFNSQGQLTQLTCTPGAIGADEQVWCGADAPSWVSLYGENGQLLRQVQFFEGREVASRKFSSEGVVVYSDERGSVEGLQPGERVERVVRRVHYADGSPRLEATYVAGRQTVQREFNKDGVQIREVRWNARNEISETLYFPNHVMARHEIPATHEGAPARMVEEYWDNGLLKSRGTFIGPDLRVGLYQTFHQEGGIAGEEFYERGRLQRRLRFDAQGLLLLEEDFRDDGSRLKTMLR